MRDVLIIEADLLVRFAMSRILVSHADMRVVKETASAEGLRRSLRGVTPDAICLGSTADGLPGTAACAAVRRRFPEVGLVMVVRPRPDDIQRAQAADPHGLVNRSTAVAPLARALHHAARAQRFVDPTLRPLLGRSAGPDRRKTFGLTPAERRVLDLLPGRTNKQVAAELGTGLETVKTQVSSILRKLDASDRAHAVAIAMKADFASTRALALGNRPALSPESRLPAAMEYRLFDESGPDRTCSVTPGPAGEFT